MTLCFNELPPKTKEAVVILSNVCDGRWNVATLGMTYKQIVASIIAYNGDESRNIDLSNDQIEVKDWFVVIKAFGLWSDDIRDELIPFCLGGKE